MAVSEKAYKEVFVRAGGRCDNPKCRKVLRFETDNRDQKRERHHVYFKSQYKKIDRDQAWNGACLCMDCHTGDKGVHGSNKKLDKLLKKKADKRKPVGERSTEVIKSEGPKFSFPKVKIPLQTEEQKEQARLYRKEASDAFTQKFKEENGGLTPGQVAYRRAKERRKEAEEKNRRQSLEGLSSPTGSSEIEECSYTEGNI